MELRRVRQRLRNFTRAALMPESISAAELDENTAALIDAALQSLLFCMSLLALVTCLARLPPLPAAAVNPPASAWPDPQSLMLGFTG